MEFSKEKRKACEYFDKFIFHAIRVMHFAGFDKEQIAGELRAKADCLYPPEVNYQKYENLEVWDIDSK